MNEQYTSPDFTIIKVNNLVAVGASGGNTPPQENDEIEIM